MAIDAKKEALSIDALSGRENSAADGFTVHCQICATECQAGLDLGHQPVGDLILNQAALNEPEVYYPMQTFHCPECGLAQLGYIVDPDIVYKDFPFVSGTTETVTKHLQALPAYMAETFKLDSNNFAVDIGSNDGTLLKGWIPSGVKFLGVDPSGDPVKIANEQGLTTWHAFFNEETAGKIIEEFGQADAITACGCFAHIANLDSLMKGIVKLLSPEGVFTNDSQYWMDMVQRLHYDNAFHQHLRYYTIRSLDYMFNQYGLEVFDVIRSDDYGGSIQVYACHKGAHPINQRVTDLKKEEIDTRLFEEATYLKYAEDVAKKKRVLFDKVYELKKQGKKIIGIGAPAKASTVCVYTGLTTDHIDYITEINPLRIGFMLPGVHIPIIEEEFMFDDPEPADAAILFAWNFYDEIVPKLRERGFTGEIILP